MKADQLNPTGCRLDLYVVIGSQSPTQLIPAYIGSGNNPSAAIGGALILRDISTNMRGTIAEALRVTGVTHTVTVSAKLRYVFLLKDIY